MKSLAELREEERLLRLIEDALYRLQAAHRSLNWFNALQQQNRVYHKELEMQRVKIRLRETRYQSLLDQLR